MTKEELLKELEKLPKIETNNPISAMNSINVDDLMSAVDRLNKIPDYNDLLKENQELKKQLEEYQLQNVDLRADIMIQKMSFPNKLIKDKTFYDLYDMPTYEELKKQVEEYQKELEKADSITQSCIFNGKEESKISYRKCLNILDKKETQQKEFMKWLESIKFIGIIPIEMVCDKYKETIGGSDEKK